MEHPHDNPPHQDNAGAIVTIFVALVLLCAALALEMAGAGIMLLSVLALGMGASLIVLGIVLGVMAWIG